jgi:hypothetical protein
LKEELETARRSLAAHIVVFQHRPYFLKDADEPEGWANIPLERRKTALALLHRAGVPYVFAGHIHQNATAKDGDLEMTAVGPVGMPLGSDGSGIRLAIVRP